MKEPYLEVTYRRGRPLAAYLYLPRPSAEKSCRSQRVEPGMVIDFDGADRPIGIEITAPGQLSLAALNRVMMDLGLSMLTSSDLAPLQAA